MLDFTRRHLVVLDEPWEDRQPSSVSGSRVRWTKLIATQGENCARTCPPAWAALRIGLEEFANYAGISLEHQHVSAPGGPALYRSSCRNGIRPGVAFAGARAKNDGTFG